MNEKKIVIPIIFLLLVPSLVFSVTSTSNEFEVTPNTLNLNWTNEHSGNITIENLNDTRNITINVHNSTSPLSHWLSSNTTKPKVKVSGSYINESILVKNGSTNTTTLEFNTTGLPGTYTGSLVFSNSSNTTENATVDLVLKKPIYIDSTGHGQFGGNITNETKNRFYFNTSSIANVAGLRIGIDEVDPKVNIKLYNSSSNLKNSTTTNGSSSLSYVFSDFSSPSSYWYFNISNSSITSYLTFTGSVELLEPSLRVNLTNQPNGTFDSDPTDSKENITFTDNIGLNKTITKYFFLKNLEDYNLTFNITDSSFLNKSSSYIEFSHNLTDTLQSNTEKKVEVNFTLNTNNTRDRGLYHGWILINSTNGYPYKKFNLSLIANITNYLDVKVTDIKSADGDSWVENNSVENITFSSKVYLFNGTELRDLNISDFSATLTHLNKSHTDGLSLTNSVYTSGQYKINATIPSNTLGGYYNLSLSVDETRDGLSLLGSGLNGTLVINNTALYFDPNDETFDIDEGNTETLNMTVTNYGPKRATGSIDLDESCADFSIDTADKKDDCGSFDDINISEGESCWFTWDLEAGSVDSDQECELDFSAPGLSFNENDINPEVDISNSKTSQQNILSNTTTTTSTTSTVGENEIKITSYPSSLEVVQGQTESFNLGVENNGENDQENLELSVSGVSSDFYSFSPSKVDLDSGNDGSFDVTINPSLEAEIKDYNITFKIENEDVSTSKETLFKVMPSDTQKAKINETYQDYKWNYTKIKNKGNELGKKVNIEELNQTIDQINKTLEEAGSEISKGNYFKAKQKLDEVDFLLSHSQEELKEAKSLKKASGAGLSQIVWILVGVVAIVIIGVFIYLSLPPREEWRLKKKTPKHVKYKNPSSLESIPKRIIDFFKNIEIKIKEFIS